MTPGRGKTGMGESQARLRLSFDISILPLAEHTREKIIHVNHCPTEQLRCCSGEGFCVSAFEGPAVQTEKNMELLWSTSHLMSPLWPSFLSLQHEHPPSRLQGGREQIFPQENKIIWGD